MFNLGLDKISTESIDFQIRGSLLANELMTIFQEVINKRESIDTIEKRVKEVPAFFKATSIPKLKAAIQKHTGFECKSVKVSRSIDMGFACLMDFGDKYGLTASTVIDRYSGLDTDVMLAEYMRANKIQPRSAADMRAIAESLNRETGIFGIDRCANKIKCTMTLYFDPYGAFLVKEVGHQKLEYLTAADITAVVLHEIGHMLSTLAHSADLCFRMQVYNRSLDYFNQSAPKEEKVKYSTDVIATLDPKLADQVRAGIDKCTAVKQNDQGSFVLNVLGWIFDCIGILVQAIFLPVSLVVDVLDGVLSETFPEMINNATNPNKHSDFYALSKQLKVCEQFADEYVTRHGMGSAQIEALRKIWSYAEYSMSFAASIGGSTKLSLAYYINKVSFVVTTMMFGDMTNGGGLYDYKFIRAQRLMQETCKVFKQQLSPEMAEFFMEDYLRCKQALQNKSVTDRIARASQLFHDLVKYLGGVIPAMLISGRISSEYERLYNNVEKLVSNPLFFRSTQLEQLLRRK